MKRVCVRPGCTHPAAATMTYDYGQGSVWITALHPDGDPHSYDLCASCAERISAPRGWVLTDLRDRPLFEATG